MPRRLDTHRIAIKNFLTVASYRTAMNGWFVYGDMRIYMRSACRNFDEVPSRDANYYSTLDLATFVINSEKKRGKGTFTRFLQFIEVAAARRAFSYLYVENVLDGYDSRLAKFLLTNGFKLVEKSDKQMPCFYKKIGV